MGSEEHQRELEGQLQKVIKSSLKTWLGRKRIRYVDYFTNKITLNTFTILTTFEPKANKKFLPLIYEIYAFTETGDARVFQDYKTQTYEFSNEFQTLRMIKIIL